MNRQNCRFKLFNKQLVCSFYPELWTQGRVMTTAHTVMWSRPLEVSSDGLSVRSCCAVARRCGPDGQMRTDRPGDPWMIVHLCSSGREPGKIHVVDQPSTSLSHAFTLSLTPPSALLPVFSSLFKDSVLTCLSCAPRGLLMILFVNSVSFQKPTFSFLLFYFFVLSLVFTLFSFKYTFYFICSFLSLWISFWT